ncbi:hypothetical protein ACQP2F_15745 [Actinoplanes sp. CA-030573]|uniref:hypothetical protein n=1 Tax=Actinoplanes sp. CA-030573 TaxID=3239898 RepID=UPI003D8DC73A
MDIAGIGDASIIASSSPEKIEHYAFNLRFNAGLVGDCGRRLNGLVPKDDVWQGIVKDPYAISAHREADTTAWIAKALYDGALALSRYGRTLAQAQRRLASVLKMAQTAAIALSRANAVIGPPTPVEQASRLALAQTAKKAQVQAEQALREVLSSVDTAAASLQGELRACASRIAPTKSLGQEGLSLLGLHEWSGGRMTNDGRWIGSGPGASDRHEVDHDSTTPSLEYFQLKVGEVEASVPVAPEVLLGAAGEAGAFIATPVFPAARHPSDVTAGTIWGSAVTIGMGQKDAATVMIGPVTEVYTSIDPTRGEPHKHDLWMAELSLKHKAIGLLAAHDELTVYHTNKVSSASIMPGLPGPEVDVHVGDGFTLRLPGFSAAVEDGLQNYSRTTQTRPEIP